VQGILDLLVFLKIC